MAQATKDETFDNDLSRAGYLQVVKLLLDYAETSSVDVKEWGLFVNGLGDKAMVAQKITDAKREANWRLEEKNMQITIQRQREQMLFLALTFVMLLAILGLLLWLRNRKSRLVEKEEEIFATVDLLEIDRVSARATLIKAGAAPTLLIRKGKSLLLEARTPPAGIMKNVIAERKSFTLEKGDMLVMLSDGVLQTGCENTILPKESIPPMPSARALASKIIREARKDQEAADDMSVCVLRVY